MEFFITTPDIVKRPEVLAFFDHLKGIAADRVGFCYYKFPLAGGTEQHLPDIVLVDPKSGTTAFDIYTDSLTDISEFSESSWTVRGAPSDAPFLKLEDYEASLTGKLQKYRALRSKTRIKSFIILTAVSKTSFEKKFPDASTENIIFDDYLSVTYDAIEAGVQRLDPNTAELFLSVAQGAGRLNSYKTLGATVTAETIGEAIGLLESRIASLEKMQHAAAIQIPDGPQRIRGLAGTGKTIVLTMKAAILHSRFPDKKILYTFHTQSLYNHIRNLITKFYRDSEEKDPNWDNLLVLHSWGSRSKEGVYYRTCLRNSIQPIPFDRARAQNYEEPLDHVCTELLKADLNEEYDFVLIDEGQDLPASFYQVVWHTTKEPKRITFAYDELQSLSKSQIADTGELFGLRKDGTKRVDFSTGTYPGGIEMDFALKRSYRNPRDVLLIAHGIGLGIYNKSGEMQIIEDRAVWESIGYVLEEGDLKKGSRVRLTRPIENSASFIHEIYTGNVPMLEWSRFANREDEVNWVVTAIKNDIEREQIPPHHIVIICLDSNKLRDVVPLLQKKLFAGGIPSLAPGFDGVDRSKFAEDGFVTISTVYKAKGNEGFMLYVMAFDGLYDYTDFVRPRNRAFTSISRSKGWLRISGVGKNMDRAVEELEDIKKYIPSFVFKFPDPEKIKRKLSTEEFARRTSEAKKARSALQTLLDIDSGAVGKVSQNTKREVLRRLLEDMDYDDAVDLISKLKK